jgi:hypothetical protein
MIMTERDRTSFERYKLLKFWSQSFLAGIPQVVVGFRDDEGVGTSAYITYLISFFSFQGLLILVDDKHS